MGNLKDYFNELENVPQNILDILSTFNEESENTYKECARVLDLIEDLGWSYEYYLDAEPYNLHPMNFDWWLQSDNVTLNGIDTYKTQCTQWNKSFTLEDLKQYYKKEYENN